MKTKIACLLVLTMMIVLTAGCGLTERNPPPEDTEDTAPPVYTPEVQQPTEAPAETEAPTSAPTATPDITPTPAPQDIPTIVGQKLDTAPVLILDGDSSAGTVSADDVFAIVLEEDSGTGSIWMWDGYDGTEVENTVDTDWQTDTAEPMDGVPGLHIWGFSIHDAGRYTLSFSMVAPEGGVSDVKEFSVTVK